jgi:hypothetical protein
MDTVTYLECDVPEGLTLAQWRRDRRPAAPARRHPWRALRRLLRSPR